MADVYLGIYARNRGIPLIRVASNEGIVKDVEEPQPNSIYEHCLHRIPSKLNQRETVNRYLKEVGWGEKMSIR